MRWGQGTSSFYVSVSTLSSEWHRAPVFVTDLPTTLWGVLAHSWVKLLAQRDSCVRLCEQRATKLTVKLAANSRLHFLGLLSGFGLFCRCPPVYQRSVFARRVGANVQLLSAGRNIFRQRENRCCCETGGNHPHPVSLRLCPKTPALPLRLFVLVISGSSSRVRPQKRTFSMTVHLNPLASLNKRKGKWICGQKLGSRRALDF